MPRAGFCAECGANVWLGEDGGCARGHGPLSISNVYETAPMPQPQKRRSMLPWILIGGWLFLVMLSAAVIAVVSAADPGGIPLNASTKDASIPYSALPREVRSRFEDEYPDWTPRGLHWWTEETHVGYNDRYVIEARPPGRDFTVGVPYTRHSSGVITADDSVMRANGAYFEHSDSLLDYLDVHHASKGHRLFQVDTEYGDVGVVWVETRVIGPFSFEREGFDVLYRDFDSSEWQLFVDPEEEN